LTLQFIEALQAAAEMESQFGSKERVRDYQAIARNASDALNRESWDGEHGVYADTNAKNSWSQQANILAVMLDVAPLGEQQKIVDRLLNSKEHESTIVDGRTVPPMSEPSYYFRFYLHRALEHAGLGDRYLGQLQPWYKMLDMGLSTWAETPEPTRSDCHAWSASPNYDLLTIVAGIRSDAPGFKRVRVSPHLAGLHHLDAFLPHPNGSIHTDYNLKGNRWNATITLPLGTEGELSWKNKAWPLHPGIQVIRLP
jgi:alpha-L-rhamnosidase